MENLLELGTLNHEISEYYNNAFREFRDEVEPMDHDDFWLMVGAYRRKVSSSIGQDGSNKPLARRFLTDRMSRWVLEGDLNARDSIKRAARFVRRWRHYSKYQGVLYERIFDFVTGYSDDGFHDLRDNLPLAGQDVIGKILSDDLSEYDDLADLIGGDLKDQARTLGVNPDDYKRHILRGENYNVQGFTEAVESQVKSLCIKLSDDPDYGFEEDEIPHAR